MQRYDNADANTSAAVQQNLYKLMTDVEGTGEQEQQRLKERMREDKEEWTPVPR